MTNRKNTSKIGEGLHETPMFSNKLLLTCYLGLLIYFFFSNCFLLFPNKEVYIYLDHFLANPSIVDINGWAYDSTGPRLFAFPVIFNSLSSWETNHIKGLILAVLGNVLFWTQVISLSRNFSASRRAWIAVIFLALPACLPLALFLEGVVWQFSQSLPHTLESLANLGNGIIKPSPLDLAALTGSIAIQLGVLAASVFVLKVLLCQSAYLRRDQEGIFLGAGIWAKIFGERRIRWEDLKTVKVLHHKTSNKKSLFVETKDLSCNIPWTELEKHTSTTEFLNDLRTNAPQAVDSSCGIKDKSGQGEYTELWLKYFSSGSTRTRSGALKAGDKLKDGQYEIAGQLGQGGQGTAYLASAKDMDKSAASRSLVLKEYILPMHRGEAVFQESLRKLEREAEILEKIKHPNIVSVRETFVEDHRGYLVMDFVEGKVLKDLVKEQGPQNEQLVIDIALQILDVLSYLHNMDPPVIHRDLTPDNLILQPDGKIKLVDFNVAHQLESQATATVVGKHAYIPPEQFRGKPLPESDLFALAGTMHFLLTSKEPEPLSVSHPRKLNAGVSEKLDEIIARASALNASDRYGDAASMREAVLEIGAGKKIRLKQGDKIAERIE